MRVDAPSPSAAAQRPPPRAPTPPPLLPAVVVCRAERDPSKRIVVTGMGICSAFGNDPAVFYDK